VPKISKKSYIQKIFYNISKNLFVLKISKKYLFGGGGGGEELSLPGLLL
jgi:hypothetical protein